MSVITSILDLAASGNAELVMRDMRVRSLWSPYYLAKVVLGYRDLVEHLHFRDSELFISRWADGSRRQLIEYPRGFFKSTSYTIATSIWVVCPPSDEDTEYAITHLGIDPLAWEKRMALHNQDALQLFAFETDSNAKKKVAEVKWHFEENTLFRAMFPEIKYTGQEEPWNANCLKIRRVGYARRAEEGTFEAIGAGNALQSRHYDIVWEDDLIGERSAKSLVDLDRIRGWHSRLNGAFVDAAKQVRFVVGNRWGYSDLNSWIREKEPGDWYIYSRAALEVDPDTGEQSAIFPERYSVEKLLEIKRSMSDYDFACQYLNSPTMPGEKEVDTSTFHTYTVGEKGVIICSCGARVSPANLYRVMSYDPYTAKDVRSMSRPAIVVSGCSPCKHKFLLDVYMAKEDYKKVFLQLFRMNTRWRPHLFTYEDVGAQNMCEFYIREFQNSTEFQNSKDLYGVTFRRFPRIEALKTGGKNMEIRIRDYLLPAVKDRFSYRPGIHEFLIHMFQSFPFPVIGHDYDPLDALAQSARRWRFPLGEEEEQAAEEQEQYFITHLLNVPYTHMEIRNG